MSDNTVDANPSKNPNDYLEPVISANGYIVLGVIASLILIYIIAKKYLL